MPPNMTDDPNILSTFQMEPAVDGDMWLWEALTERCTRSDVFIPASGNLHDLWRE